MIEVKKKLLFDLQMTKTFLLQAKVRAQLDDNCEKFN